jgi:hypothetical protein
MGAPQWSGTRRFITDARRLAVRSLFDWAIRALPATLSDLPGLAEVASAAGMDILGPPLNDKEVAAIVREEQI